MNIHELNTKTPGSTAYVALDDGTDTYKANLPGINLQNNPVTFTSGDSSTATSWTSVSTVSSGSTLSVLLNRISTMIKNVRYLYNLIGTASMGTTATTLTGAISEVRTSVPTVDSALNVSSTNPVQNGIITQNIERIDDFIGTATMGTTATTITGAIAELDNAIDAMGTTCRGVTDGVLIFS